MADEAAGFGTVQQVVYYSARLGITAGRVAVDGKQGSEHHTSGEGDDVPEAPTGRWPQSHRHASAVLCSDAAIPNRIDQFEPMSLSHTCGQGKALEQHQKRFLNC